MPSSKIHYRTIHPLPDFDYTEILALGPDTFSFDAVLCNASSKSLELSSANMLIATHESSHHTTPDLVYRVVYWARSLVFPPSHRTAYLANVPTYLSLDSDHLTSASSLAELTPSQAGGAHHDSLDRLSSSTPIPSSPISHSRHDLIFMTLILDASNCLGFELKKAPSTASSG